MKNLFPKLTLAFAFLVSVAQRTATFASLREGANALEAFLSR
ncbi:hypothetical protein HMPREF0971_01748 [Segatella oris F0302]|uniref:Uncharacterized protein n=1 Tax=Segatella oris F0302 TaxID=649760 RepID=D1QRZ2_9BACT|nr:hypothetical protein HMPREF0971_01748 [Segatella oris F0302]